VARWSGDNRVGRAVLDLCEVTGGGQPRAIAPEAAKRLAASLVPAGTRDDGLPRWSPGVAGDPSGAWVWAAARTGTATTRKRGDRVVVRAIWAAVAVDLYGRREDAVSAYVLGLVDHELAGDARRARETIGRGRAILSALGAWPWAHAPVERTDAGEVHSGRLPASWWTRDAFALPLRCYLAAVGPQPRSDATLELCDSR
jgi:hypothetical protein